MDCTDYFTSVVNYYDEKGKKDKRALNIKNFMLLAYYEYWNEVP